MGNMFGCCRDDAVEPDEAREKYHSIVDAPKETKSEEVPKSENFKELLASTSVESQQLQNELQKIQESNVRLLEEIRTLSAEKSDLQERLQRETAEKTTQLSLANAAKEELCRESEVIKAQNNTLSDSVAGLGVEQTALQQKLEQEISQKKAAQAELGSLRTQSKTLGGQLDEANVAKQELQKQLGEKEHQNLSLLEAVRALRQENAELRAQLTEKDEKNASELSELQQQLMEAQSALQSVTMDKRALENGSPVKKYPGLKAEHQRLQDAFKVVQAELQVKSQQLNHPLVKKIFG